LRTALPGAAAVLLLFAGCRAMPLARRPDRAVLRAMLDAQAAARMDVVDFSKPNQANVTAFDPYLAPLILEEISSGTSAASFGVVFDVDGRVRVDSSRPTVYYWQQFAELNGKVHEQLAFAWIYPDRSGSPGLVQGVRQTLDRNGFPFVYEVLPRHARGRVAYVSLELESEATRALGGPLAGNRYTVEPDAAQLPDVVVAGTTADGPEPMGPYLYLRSGTREISHLHCRCSPTRFKKLRHDRQYELVRGELLAVFGIPSPWSEEASAELVRCLRLGGTPP